MPDNERDGIRIVDPEAFIGMRADDARLMRERKLAAIEEFNKRIRALVKEVFPEATEGQCVRMWVGMLLTFDKAGIEMYVNPVTPGAAS